MYTVGVAGLGFSSVAGTLMENFWASISAAQQELALGVGPPAPSCERLFMSFWVNYTHSQNTRHHISTREPKEDLQEQSRAFIKACTVLCWSSLHCWGNKSHLKVSGKLEWITWKTSAIRSTLKPQRHEVYMTIIKLQDGRAGFLCVRLPASVEGFNKFKEKKRRKRRIL